VIRNDPGADAAGFKLSPASQLKHISVHHDFFDLMLDPTEPDADHYPARLGNGDSRGPLMDLGATLGYWRSPDANEQLRSRPFNPCVS